MIITSFTNQKVKLIRKLEHKKYRQETGLFFIEGLRTVGEAIQTIAPIEALIIAPELLVSDFGRSLLVHPTLQNIEVVEVSAEVYHKIAHKEGPQGIGAIVRQIWVPLDQTAVGERDIWIALDAVSDPGNLGTTIRTADAVGSRGIILLGHSTDPYDPTAVKASMGSIFSLDLVQTEWKPFYDWCKVNRLSLVGTSDRAPTDYQRIAYKRPLVLLMGSERHGLSSEMQAACDQMASIPMVGRSDSLNLAVSTALMLYEIFNQFREKDIITS
jgi:RNA methyltransferase, TrmH family